jgi:hypothetical protein
MPLSKLVQNVKNNVPKKASFTHTAESGPAKPDRFPTEIRVR